VDGSFFPSSSAVNPALTIMANALRVGDHILERLGASRGEALAAGWEKVAAVEIGAAPEGVKR
jgi:choline dehydrogenase-like flavoprotein